MTQAEQIYANFKHGWKRSDRIVVGDRIPQGVGVQQNNVEIITFIDALLQILHPCQRVLAMEIGLCFGGTHLMWKQMFVEVISVESSIDMCDRFMSGLQIPEGSTLVCADSRMASTRRLVDCELEGCPLDLLFIDGDHSFEGVEGDYVNYEPLVRKGGVVAFHDTVNAYPEVTRFIDMLDKGQHCYLPRVNNFKHIHDKAGEGPGISYYVK